MTRRYLKVFILLLFTALLQLSGCGSSKQKVLADVGDDQITLEDFEYYTRNLNATFTSAQEEFDFKSALLDTMISSRLLVQAAYEYGLDKSEEVARVVLANKDKFLLDILYQKNVLDNIDVTEAEIKEYHDKLEYKIRAYQIVVNDADTAQMLFERARAGENFEQLAYDYSTDPDVKRNRGDLGYFVWGAMVEEFQRVAFQMKPGELSPPVKTRYGYHIIKHVDRLTNDLRADYEQMAPSIERQIQKVKIHYETEEYFEGIMAKYPIVIDTATCDYVMFKREQLYPPQILATMPRSDFDTDQLDRSEKELIIATWEGGQVTLYDYLISSQRVPIQYRPDIDNYETVAELVFEIRKEEILAYEANKQGLENEEQFKMRLGMFKELSMADLVRIDSIEPAHEVTDAMVRNYFESDKEEFTIVRRIHLYEILTSDELLANRLRKEIKTLDQFKKQAQKYTERPAQRNTDGDLGYIEKKWFPEIFPVAWSTSTGRIAGPVATLGKHSIFYVVNRIEAQLQDYLGVKNQIYAKLVQEQVLLGYIEWINARKAKTNIEVFGDALWSSIDESKYAARDSVTSSDNL